MRFAQENSFAPLKRFFPPFSIFYKYTTSRAHCQKMNFCISLYFFLPLAMKQATAQKNAVGINFYFEQKIFRPIACNFNKNI